MDVPDSVIHALSEGGMSAIEIAGYFPGVDVAGALDRPKRQMTAEEYDTLPHDVAKWIEVVDGWPVVRR